MATPTTLPAAFTAGQVLTAAQQNALRGAFRVLQVVSATTSTEVSSSVATMTDTGLTATITPSSTTSKVLVIVTQSAQKSAGSAINSIFLDLLRSATVIADLNGVLYTGTTLEQRGILNLMALDSPNTTSATTYKTQFAPNGATASVAVQHSSSYSTIVLMEISA
jgi:hypothetical protein